MRATIHYLASATLGAALVSGGIEITHWQFWAVVVMAQVMYLNNFDRRQYE